MKTEDPKLDDSFEALFRREYAGLVSFGTAALGDFDLARDLAQETMARANADWQTVSAASQPGAWLQRTMSNLVTDTYRRRAVERRAVERVGRNESVAEMVRDSLSDAEFVRLVAALPERQRMIVTMFYVGDLSVEQIAAALDIAPGTAKASLWKARQSIERRLRAEGVNE